MAAHFWRDVRAVDSNAPFALVTTLPMPGSVTAHFRPGYDMCIAAAATPYETVLLLECLLNTAELRSLRARIEEERAITEELEVQLRSVEAHMARASASVARAETHLLRAHALKAYTSAGGTLAYFERHSSEALQHVRDRATGPG